ncbi:hypothetical protein K501DRAFT_273225 [Backusella circina FSU 941]|nr:hypothetical protein K501DRAFT_273225 [Backusella circina FSU 941]
MELLRLKVRLLTEILPWGRSSSVTSEVGDSGHVNYEEYDDRVTREYFRRAREGGVYEWRLNPNTAYVELVMISANAINKEAPTNIIPTTSVTGITLSILKLKLENSPVDMLPHLPSLTGLCYQITLKMDAFSDTTVNLTDYLIALPNMIKLIPPLNIQKLKIACTELTSEIADMISSCFQKLIKLEITAEIREEDIILQSSSVGYVTMFDVTPEKYGFTFKYPNQAEPKYYQYANEKYPRVTYQDIHGHSSLAVVLSTEKRYLSREDILK